MAFLISSIGSFPKPPALHEARRRFSDGEIEAAALREVEDEATRRVLGIQDELGVDLLVDGEMDRADPITTFAERLAGVEIDGWVRVYGDRYARRAEDHGSAGAYRDHDERALAISRAMRRGRPVKAVIPGPYSLMDGSFDQHYGSRREVCLAFAEIVREEAAELAAAGATEIQIDEPAAGARPEEVTLMHEALERVVEPLRGRSQSLALSRLPGSRVAGSRARPASGERLARRRRALRLRRRRGVHARPSRPTVSRAIGVIDVASAVVETEDEVRARLTMLAKHVPADRLWAVPDGGFRALRPEIARAKLAVLVAAAK